MARTKIMRARFPSLYPQSVESPKETSILVRLVEGPATVRGRGVFVILDREERRWLIEQLLLRAAEEALPQVAPGWSEQERRERRLQAELFVMGVVDEARAIARDGKR